MVSSLPRANVAAAELNRAVIVIGCNNGALAVKSNNVPVALNGVGSAGVSVMARC